MDAKISDIATPSATNHIRHHHAALQDERIYTDITATAEYSTRCTPQELLEGISPEEPLTVQSPQQPWLNASFEEVPYLTLVERNLIMQVLLDKHVDIVSAVVGLAETSLCILQEMKQSHGANLRDSQIPRSDPRPCHLACDNDKNQISLGVSKDTRRAILNKIRRYARKFLSPPTPRPPKTVNRSTWSGRWPPVPSARRATGAGERALLRRPLRPQ